MGRGGSCGPFPFFLRFFVFLQNCFNEYGKPDPQTTTLMSCLRVLLAIIFPPLSVIDKGCGSFLIVLILTAIGWVPGVIGALIILNKNRD